MPRLGSNPHPPVYQNPRVINVWFGSRIQEVVENNKENLDTSNEESLDTRDPLELQHSNKNTGKRKKNIWCEHHTAFCYICML
jgi:hypothetical protein